MDQATKTKVVNGLRARKGDQIGGRFYDSRDGRLGCAVGIMAEVLGYDRADHFRRGNPADGATKYLLNQGFTLFQLRHIVEMNDAKLASFDAIADWIDKHVKAFDPFRTLIGYHDCWTLEVERYANSKALTNV